MRRGRSERTDVGAGLAGENVSVGHTLEPSDDALNVGVWKTAVFVCYNARNVECELAGTTWKQDCTHGRGVYWQHVQTRRRRGEDGEIALRGTRCLVTVGGRGAARAARVLV